MLFFRLSLLDKSSSQPNQNWPSLLELEVLSSSTQEPPESSDFWDSDNSTTELSSESTRPQSIFWEELNHTSLSDTHQEKQSENSSSREDSVRSISKESPLPATLSLSKFWASTVSFQLKIWSMKSPLSALISRKPTTSCGHSSLEPQEEVSLKRDTPSKEEEIGETENNSSTNLSLTWFDLYSVFKSIFNFLTFHELISFKRLSFIFRMCGFFKGKIIFLFINTSFLLFPKERKINILQSDNKKYK